MFCGSCMHDNTLANALHAAGAEVSLIPTYTPIRVDEDDASEKHVYLGGINVFLESRSRIWRALPAFCKHWLDAGWVINLATRVGVTNNAKKLGELTLDMLAGEAGPERRGVEELAAHLVALRPDVVLFSNALLSGALRALRERYDGPVLCLLQGDDVFLDELPEEYRDRAVAAISERAVLFDGYLVHSDYYRRHMARYLRLPAEKFHKVPLGIDLTGHDGLPKAAASGPAGRFTVGYFARICPEKGLHNLLEGFKRFHARHPDTQLCAGGSLTKKDAGYFKEVRRAARDLGDAFRHVGSPTTHREKVDFLKSLDVLSVPTSYREPKGLYVLEALANGVPVVQPRHGAFPELLEATGGGVLVNPEDPDDLARGLAEMYKEAERREALARAGYENVRRSFGPQTMAAATLTVFAEVVRGPRRLPVEGESETVAAAELAETRLDPAAVRGSPSR